MLAPYRFGLRDVKVTRSVERETGCMQTAQLAGVAELADAHDSKSRSFGSVGSIPFAGMDLKC